MTHSGHTNSQEQACGGYLPCKFPNIKRAGRATPPSRCPLNASVSSSSHDWFIANPFGVQCINHAAGCQGSPVYVPPWITREGCWKLSFNGKTALAMLPCFLIHVCNVVCSVATARPQTSEAYGSWLIRACTESVSNIPPSPQAKCSQKFKRCITVPICGNGLPYSRYRYRYESLDPSPSNPPGLHSQLHTSRRGALSGDLTLNSALRCCCHIKGWYCVPVRLRDLSQLQK